MGPLFWRHPEHGLKKCAERTGNSCDPAETDGCCAVTACSYCLELAIYGDPSVFSEDPATFTGTGWSGSVGNHTFFGYWERNIYTDECEFIVLFDGEEVYRKSCYEGQSCRDSSDETTVTVGYDEGTLYWRRVEPLPLAHIVDPDTGCKTWYCDSCDCSCTTLCATITEPNGRVQKGELDNVAYECEPPIWEGQIGYYDLSLALGRDIYGRCIIVATVDEEEQTAVLAPGCKNLSTIIELYDGTTIEVACKICDCDIPTNICCPDRCNTVSGESCDNPLPTTLTCTLTVSTVKNDPISGAATGCFSVTGTLHLSPLNGWIGVVSGSCSGWCGGATRTFEYEARVTCGLSPDGTIQWFLNIQENLGSPSGTTCTNTGIPIAYAILDSVCDPILLTGQTTPFDCLDLNCVIPLLGIDEVFGEIIFDVLVTEDP